MFVATRLTLLALVSVANSHRVFRTGNQFIIEDYDVHYLIVEGRYTFDEIHNACNLLWPGSEPLMPTHWNESNLANLMMLNTGIRKLWMNVFATNSCTVWPRDYCGRGFIQEVFTNSPSIRQWLAQQKDKDRYCVKDRERVCFRAKFLPIRQNPINVDHRIRGCMKTATCDRSPSLTIPNMDYINNTVMFKNVYTDMPSLNETSCDTRLPVMCKREVYHFCSNYSITNLIALYNRNSMTRNGSKWGPATFVHTSHVASVKTSYSVFPEKINLLPMFKNADQEMVGRQIYILLLSIAFAVYYIYDAYVQFPSWRMDWEGYIPSEEDEEESDQ